MNAEKINVFAKLRHADPITQWGANRGIQFTQMRINAGAEWYGTYSPKHSQLVWFRENELHDFRELRGTP